MKKLRRINSLKTRKTQKKSLKTKALAASAAAMISLSLHSGNNKVVADTIPDPHQQTVKQDTDKDIISDSEEISIGYNPFNDDQNKNSIHDGVELARHCAEIILDLPEYYPGQPNEPNETYKILHALDGLETCQICSIDIHMGGWEIVNPKLHLHYPAEDDPMDNNFLPELAVHYMQHGSFDCLGSYHKGRSDINRLLAVLELRFPEDANDHLLPLAESDIDNDLLSDEEELSIETNLNDPDQNNNLITDGIELAKQCEAVIENLPWQEQAQPGQTYKWLIPQYGLETCEICGQTVNMGPAGIVNPALGIEIDCPLIVIHYMEHGSFSYAGDVHGRNRIDVPMLIKVLEMPTQCDQLTTIYNPADFNKDCKTDFADFAQIAQDWLESTDPN